MKMPYDYHVYTSKTVYIYLQFSIVFLVFSSMKHKIRTNCQSNLSGFDVYALVLPT